MEAASVLGSILGLPYMVSQAPSLDPRSVSMSMLRCAGAKDHVSMLMVRFCAAASIFINGNLIYSGTVIFDTVFEKGTDGYSPVYGLVCPDGIRLCRTLRSVSSPSHRTNVRRDFVSP